MDEINTNGIVQHFDAADTPLPPHLRAHLLRLIDAYNKNAEALRELQHLAARGDAEKLLEQLAPLKTFIVGGTIEVELTFTCDARTAEEACSIANGEVDNLSVWRTPMDEPCPDVECSVNCNSVEVIGVMR